MPCLRIETRRGRKGRGQRLPVGVEDILDELHDGIDVADDFRLGGPPRQRGHRSGGVGQLGRRRLRGGRGLVGGVGAGEEAPAAGQCGRGCGGARREGRARRKSGPRRWRRGECRCQGHAAEGDLLDGVGWVEVRCD